MSHSSSIPTAEYDGHGSARYLTDDLGQITDAYTYDTFGVLLDDWHLGEATPNDHPYTGKRYDRDFGKYYLRARYYKPDTGRFWTMDSFEGNQQDPLSLHKYLYCSADPVNRSDPSGKWATFVHKSAARAHLGALLSDRDIDIICEMQDEVDGKNNQTAAKSFMHAMTDGETKETVDHAKLKANDRIRKLLTQARELEAKGGGANHEDAMKELGRALHTLQDSTSPVHAFLPWYDYPGGVANPHEWAHGGREAIDPGFGSYLTVATLNSYSYFKSGRTMPSDFFADLGVDGVLDRPKEKIRKFRIPSFNTIWMGGSLGGGFGLAF